MTRTYEIEINLGNDFWFDYVEATSEAEAVAVARAKLTRREARWARLQTTGR